MVVISQFCMVFVIKWTNEVSFPIDELKNQKAFQVDWFYVIYTNLKNWPIDDMERIA